MDYKLLELHFAQLSEAWQESKYNNYSDSKKKAYHDRLETIFATLDEENFSTLDTRGLAERRAIIDFFFMSLEFLNGSVLNAIPFELVKCLEEALNDWIGEGHDYIIVTSLVSDVNHFSFDPILVVIGDYYIIIHSVCKVEFPHKLVQINLPKSLVRDYLAGVILYHELGHFVDHVYSCSRALSNEILQNILSGEWNIEENGSIDINKYFPYLSSNKKIQSLNQDQLKSLSQVLESHVAEYFCDLFASQYISYSSGHYLDYIAGNNGVSPTHPATRNRNDLVRKFLDNSVQSFTLNKIKESVVSITNNKLDIRYERFETEDFLNLIPYEVENVKQLHHLFTYGWDIWLNRRHEIEEKNNMQFSLSGRKAYGIINNLIEKSIGNYIVETNWQKNKNVLDSE